MIDAARNQHSTNDLTPGWCFKRKSCNCYQQTKQI